MIFSEILNEDGISYETTLRSIISSLGSPTSNLYVQFKISAENYYASSYDPEGRDAWPGIKSMLSNRWKEDVWKDSLLGDLQNLCKFKSIQCQELKDYISALNAEQYRENTKFKNLEANLPGILMRVAKRLKEKRLFEIAKKWRERIKEFEEYQENLKEKANEYTDDYGRRTSSLQPEPKPRDDLSGKQASTAEDIVNNVLKQLPKKIAGEVRNAIARSPNKLMALQKELSDRNISI